MRRAFLLFAFLSTSLIIFLTLFLSSYFGLLILVLAPLLIMGFIDYFQTRHTIKRNFPILGRFRYFAEEIRPGVQQYFIESNIDGRPFNRNDRSVAYQRAKKEKDTTPFGTQLNVYDEGYEWINHSIAALDMHNLKEAPRVKIGGDQCLKPYDCSLLNVSAMSYGSLSKNAVMALNGGAKIGGFAQNTGEGGVSPYHLKNGGDLIFQFGTGYFGCRDEAGNFSDEAFKETASHPNIKMIEIKLSQGAKPGHGGILPAKKNNAEIAKIRKVKQGTDVLSPPFHTAFNTPKELCLFIKKVRNLSGGKPVGFKLCVGRPHEFVAICKAILETKIKPDFIAVDGGEGGTGAAPLEFSNAVGMPLKEGLAFVYDTLNGFDLKKDIKIIASGKIITGFHMVRTFALGADVCYSARGMMLSLGCIQARQCNLNNCPTGITTHDHELMAGLVVGDKQKRAASYHHETVKSCMEILAAANLKYPHQLNRDDINRRVVNNLVQTYEEIYPTIKEGRLLKSGLPDFYKKLITQSTPDSFEKVRS